jgi:hypothetical protein
MIQDLPKRQCCWTDRAAVHLEHSSRRSFLVEIHGLHLSIELETVFLTTEIAACVQEMAIQQRGESSRHSATRL